MVDAITLAPRGTTWPETTRSNRHRSQSERPHVRQSNGYPRDVAQEGNRSNSQVLPGTHYYRPRNVGDRESKIHKKHLEYISQLERAKILAVGERDRLSRDVYEKELLCQKLQKDIHEYKQSIPLSARFDADVLDHVIRARLDKLYRKSMDWAVKTARFMNAGAYIIVLKRLLKISLHVPQKLKTLLKASLLGPISSSSKCPAL